MRLRRTHRLMACSLLAVYLLGGKVAAQQAGAVSALTSKANPGAENVRATEVIPVELARKDFYPDFTVGLTYFNRPGMPEMYGVNIGVKIPLYFWQRQRPAMAEAAASARAERERLENAT